MKTIKDRDATSALTSSGRARRRFLERSALVTAATCTAPMLAAPDEPKPAASAKCPDVKIPMKDVAGKVAFITGGSSGIGLGIARAFADAGMKIVITYRTPAHLDEGMKVLAGAQDRVHAIRADVTDRLGMEKAAQEAVKVFGKLHVLVNNAGTQNSTPLGEMSYADWDQIMAVNLTGVFNGVHALMPFIRSHGEGGQIITTASTMGLFALGSKRYGAYSATKFAVVGLMEALRAELADSNVGVSAFCPGLVGTNLEKGLKEMPAAADPLDIGRLVLRGMRNNDLYILTHPEFEPLIRERTEAILASTPKDVNPSEARLEVARSLLKRSIYATERDRRLCINGSV